MGYFYVRQCHSPLLDVLHQFPKQFIRQYLTGILALKDQPAEFTVDGAGEFIKFVFIILYLILIDSCLGIKLANLMLYVEILTANEPYLPF